MNKEIKNIINVILPAIALAMGVATIVLSVVDNDVSVMDLIRMLGIAVISLGLFALNKTKKGSEK